MILKTCFFFKKDFIYSFMRDTQREAETQAEGEAGSLRGPDAGLDPGTRGHVLGRRQVLTRWAPPGCPVAWIFYKTQRMETT